MESICKICNQHLSDDKRLVVKIGQVGAQTINNASSTKGLSLHVEPGIIIHVKCRAKYTNVKYIHLFLKHKDNSDIQKLLRSPGLSYNSKTECIFCGKPDKYKGKKEKHKLSPVRTHEFEEAILDHGTKREDNWAENVFLRLDFIHTDCSDLIAGDAVYHKQCHVNFATYRNIPEIFSSQDDKTPSKKVKINPEDVRQHAFDEAVEFFQYEYSDEIFTVKDVSTKMK